MNFDDLMRQAGLEAIKAKDFRSSRGQEMTSPEQDRYHAAFYFAVLVRKAARVQALEEAAKVCYDIAESHGRDWGRVCVAEACQGAIRRMGEEAGRGES